MTYPIGPEEARAADDDPQANEQPGHQVVSWDEALEKGFPVLDPLGNRIHHPGEEQYEAWREEHHKSR